MLNNNYFENSALSTTKRINHELGNIAQSWVEREETPTHELVPLMDIFHVIIMYEILFAAPFRYLFPVIDKLHLGLWRQDYIDLLYPLIFRIKFNEDVMVVDFDSQKTDHYAHSKRYIRTSSTIFLRYEVGVSIIL